LKSIIYHRRNDIPENGYDEIIPMSRLAALSSKIGIVMDKQHATAIRRVHEGNILTMTVLEADLERMGAKNNPPEDKRHLQFSFLSPESISMLKRLNQYCEK